MKQQSWVIREIHHIGGENKSFLSLHFYTALYRSTKAAKATQLDTSSRYQQNTQKNNNSNAGNALSLIM